MNVARVIRAIVKAWGAKDFRIASVAIEPCCGDGEIRKLRARLMVRRPGCEPRSEIEVCEEPTLDAALLSLAEQVCRDLHAEADSLSVSERAGGIKEFARQLRCVLEQEV